MPVVPKRLRGFQPTSRASQHDTYQTTNLKAAFQPLRSIVLIRLVSCLDPAFQHDPAAVARQMAARTLDLARITFADHEEAYADAKAEVGACNRMRRKDRHDRAIYSDRAVARRLSAAFGTRKLRRPRMACSSTACSRRVWSRRA